MLKGYLTIYYHNVTEYSFSLSGIEYVFNKNYHFIIILIDIITFDNFFIKVLNVPTFNLQFDDNSYMTQVKINVNLSAIEHGEDIVL